MRPTSALSRAVVDRLRKRFSKNLVAVALFGSAARGEATEDSDLDFLVVLREVPWSLERRYEVFKPIRDALTAKSRKNRGIVALLF